MLHCDFTDFFFFLPFVCEQHFEHLWHIGGSTGQLNPPRSLLCDSVCMMWFDFKVVKNRTNERKKTHCRNPNQTIEFLFLCSINIRRFQMEYPPHSNTVIKKRWITSSACIFTIMCIYVWGKTVLLHFFGLFSKFITFIPHYSLWLTWVALSV